MTPDWQAIRYPQPLRVGDTIGVTAPSSGVSEREVPVLELCIGHLRSLGHDVVEGPCLRANRKHVSGSREQRLAALMAFWRDERVKAILPPRGGHLLIHLLESVDFERLAGSPPTWLLGYSDIAMLMFPLTILTGIATAHGPALLEMLPNQAGTLTGQWRDVLGLAAGGSITLSSSERFQRDRAGDPPAPFALTAKTHWRCMRRGKELETIEMHGRIIGGCLETLSVLVGTPYGDLPGFRRCAGDDGVILYLENCESSPTYVCRMLWNMRLAGWFDGLSGLLLGRSGGADTEHFTYADALHDVLDDLPLPVIYDADVGHRPPQMTIINGARATVTCTGGRGTVTLTLA